MTLRMSRVLMCLCLAVPSVAQAQADSTRSGCWQLNWAPWVPRVRDRVALDNYPLARSVELTQRSGDAGYLVAERNPNVVPPLSAFWRPIGADSIELWFPARGRPTGMRTRLARRGGTLDGEAIVYDSDLPRTWVARSKLTGQRVPCARGAEGHS